jgi:predicted phosphodiesterase
MHNGSAYGCFRHGHDEVIDYVVDSYPRSGLTTYLISGNHDHSGYNYSGINIVKHICNYREDFRYLGMAEGSFQIFGKSIYVYHGRGGGTYSTRLLKAYDYARDQRIEPDILIAGHLHQLCEMQKNGTKLILSPCLQGQTLHFKESRLVPWIGYCIVHVRRDLVWVEPVQCEEILEDYP